jgi:uncharacterized protein YheU (UPF0270 family)
MQQNYATEAWLLIGLIHSLPGVFSLKKGVVSFTAVGEGTLGKKGLQKLALKTGVDDLPEQLRGGEAVTLFKKEVAAIEKITFPAVYFSAGLHLRLQGQQYRLSFIRPNNTSLPVHNRGNYSSLVKQKVITINTMQQARQSGKAWKALLV